MDDLVLWHSFLAGDKDSFQKIYATYYQNLYSYGMRRVNHPDLVRDCIQDVFVNLWSKRAGIGTTNNIKFYLLAALRNQLLQASVQGSRFLQVDIGNAEQFRLEFDPESILITKENLTGQAKMLIEALEKLTPRQKEVLYLIYFEELGHEDIATMLDLSVKGVYKLKYRGLDALKLILGVSKAEVILLILLVRGQIIHL